ncbi:MAG: FAD-binding oxidoreductase, partial [Winogradskyella sp.]|nr:FAD-binding oxidoreductase [Winogradskyella sp.]
EFIDKAFKNQYLTSFHIAYSQEQEEKIYVQDILIEKGKIISDVLKKEGVIMICGSIAMQNKVLEVLDVLTKSKLQQPLSTFENNEQVKMDCY